MEQIVLIVHLLLALAIIGLIMLQQGKGADMGASFGAGASQTLLGSTGSANVLTRTTAWLVAAFFATSFGLAIIATGKTRSVNDVDIVVPASQQRPALEDAPADDLPAVETGDVPSAAPAEGDFPGADIPEA
ncbi:preprotein translocase subunit SecG [Pseudohaliea rubra]|uniref:Protein-export membrane protein SecG n=1 Tax=Pseudohaliea rubra DSM 19751 TaxID=1265313 RepID=A0A095VMJ8_9GAMM|nr:preprotein translocase subunit SecG [Pseudohaliea rubra]KGE02692.1 Preprotein translocase subunit SecG [Pseudohaliea rubra DSM 19751]